MSPAVDWTAAFLVLFVAHVAGDFLLQTEFQATRKVGGLGSDPDARKALLSHLLTYSVPMAVPLVWFAIAESPLRAVAAVAISLGTHLVQDDGRLLRRWVLRVKHTDAAYGTPLWIAVDQSAHLVWLFVAALVAAA